MASKARDVSGAPNPGDVDVDDERPREKDKEKRRSSTKSSSDRREKETKSSLPSPSTLSSLLSSTLSAHRSPHGHKSTTSASSSRPSKSRPTATESDLIYPLPSPLSRGHRHKHHRHEGEGSTTTTKSRHRSSSHAHHSSRHRPKDEASMDQSSRKPSPAPEDGASGVDVVPELNRSRDRLPYPTINKAYSRETVMSREDLTGAGSTASGSATARRRADPLTPDATDLSAGGKLHRSKSTGSNAVKHSDGGSSSSPAPSSVPLSRKSSRRSRHNERPPSPPDTNFSNSKEAKVEDVDEDNEDNHVEDDRRGNDHDDDNDSSVVYKMEARIKIKPKTRSSKEGSASRQREPSPIRVTAPSSPENSTKSMASSQATYKAQQQQQQQQKQKQKQNTTQLRSSLPPPMPEPSDADLSPESAQDSSSPKTPTTDPSPKFYTTAHWKQPPTPAHPHPDLRSPRSPRPFDGMAGDMGTTPSSTPGITGSEATASFSSNVPSTAPPPPPPLNIADVPRIDYLMHNGGLPYGIPKSFLSVLPRQSNPRPPNPPLQGAETLFAPFFGLLGQYQTVLQNHGSVAVATGHRTVARRLLDRLENVFSRELPAEGCSCVVCDAGSEYHRGLGWGEVLERVSGRIDLPTWPPLNIAALEQRLDAAAAAAAAVAAGTAPGAADLPMRPASPVKIDPDIADEFREHYLRQNKKVRASVDRWMRECAEAPSSAPQEIDDETLAFAILTNLSHEDRPLFNALLSGTRDLTPAVRAPTPMRKPRQDFIIKSGLSVQRLYRLSSAPRDAETALYLVKNPAVHDLLHTIADIHPSEWEILVSGRFDGFLWSGADSHDLTTPVAGDSQGFAGGPLSRGPTPGGVGGHGASTPVSRNVTPASFLSVGTGMSAATTASAATRQAVSTDEEAEVAALAEVEREIYQGMEALEDAFEVLHRRAEAVRTALRQRSAGLSMRLQQRRAQAHGGGGAGAGGSGSGSGGVGPGRLDGLPQSGGGLSSGGKAERPSWYSNSQTPSPAHDSQTPSDSEWDGADDYWELKPEDSASNISSSQHRRPKRRTERRTPAPIEEEDE